MNTQEQAQAALDALEYLHSQDDSENSCRAYETIRAALEAMAQEKTVDVEDFERNLKQELCQEFSQHSNVIEMIIETTINHLTAQGYFTQPQDKTVDVEGVKAGYIRGEFDEQGNEIGRVYRFTPDLFSKVEAILPPPWFDKDREPQPPKGKTK